VFILFDKPTRHPTSSGPLTGARPGKLSLDALL